MTWREYRNVVWTCNDGIRKDKAQMEWILVKDVKNNQEGFYKCMGQKRKVKNKKSH